MVDDDSFLPSRKDMKSGKKAVDNGNWNVSVLKKFALNMIDMNLMIIRSSIGSLS